MLISGAESLAAGTTTSAAAGASAQLIGANTERNGLRISSDGASTVFLLLGAGTASATNFHLVLTTGASSWDGTLGEIAFWRGAVQFFGTGARVAVVEF